MSANDGFNRDQHFILKGKDGVYGHRGVDSDHFNRIKCLLLAQSGLVVDKVLTFRGTNVGFGGRTS